MRRGLGPPTSSISASTSSQMAFTWRSLAALAITNQPQRASTSPTSSTTTSAPCLLSAARAAAIAHNRVSSRGFCSARSFAPLPLHVLTQHDGDIERVGVARILHHAPGGQRLDEIFGG